MPADLRQPSVPSRVPAAKAGPIMSQCERLTTLLPANAHAGSEKNKAAARKIDNLITIPKRSGTYPTTATDLQEHLCIGVQIKAVAAGADRGRSRHGTRPPRSTPSATSVVDRPIHSHSGTIFFPALRLA